MSSAPRVIVVGGGLIGVNCAYYLARAGAQVVLLERSRIGSGASSGNAGTVAAGHPPLNRPGRVGQAIRQVMDSTSPLYVRPRWDPALWRWLVGFARYCTEAHVEHCMRVMAPLGRQALGLFETLLREERIECEYRVEGFYDVCSTERGVRGARHEAEIVRTHGFEPELLDGDELRRREPAFGPDLIGGVFYPEAATLVPELFLNRLAAAASRRGVEVRVGAGVDRIVTEGARVTGVRLVSGETVSGDAVVLSTGPFSLRLARRLGVRVPVQPGKGYHRDIEIGPNGAPPLRVSCVINESSVFCNAMGTSVRLAGTMEFSGENSVLRSDRLRQLTNSARACFPGLGTARPISEWSGLRPMAVDGLPIVGAPGGVEGLVVATGHGMLGLTLGPVTGEMVANHLLDGGDSRMEPLSPDRFS